MNLGGEVVGEGQEVVGSSVSGVGIKGLVLSRLAEFGLPFQFLCGVVRALAPPSQLARGGC